MRLWKATLGIASLIAGQTLLCAQAADPVGGSQEAVELTPAALPKQVVGLEVQDKSFFTDRMATAVVYFDTIVEAPDYWRRESDTCTVIEIEVIETPDNGTHPSAAILRFLPKQAGVITLPILDFASETIAYETEPLQVIVSEPQRTSEMSLSFRAAKQTVYVGEPLRLDLLWDCQVNAASLKALQLNPAFFENQSVEVVIPRSTDVEAIQMGLPIGGRRVIARRTQSADDSKALGQVSLPLYLRFTEPGRITLPEVRLECAFFANATSDFGRYAAHFNNSLFEAAETSQYFERIYTVAAPVEIEVLELPPEQVAGLSGLYEPIEFDLSVRPTEVEIGEIMELEIQVSADAPHGMLDLPKLSEQPGLRERFLVDDQYGRLWHANGTTFRARIRALSTTIQAFPSLQFKVFDPSTGSYLTRITDAIPLNVQPHDGQNYLPLKNFDGAAVTLTYQPDGIWHNMEANPMNDLLNTLYGIIRIGFWPLVLVGPLVFFLLLPVVNERRRRAIDTRYRIRAEAYAAFKQHPVDSREKWLAFLRFMATTFDSGETTWTRSDSERALKRIGADAEDFNDLIQMHSAADAEDFSKDAPQAAFRNLNAIAKRITHLATKTALALTLLTLFLGPTAEADEWAAAEVLFVQAQEAPAGSELANALYQDAALKAESAARANSHVGEAWYNAGNAWFQAGHLGRAIVAYRNAQNYFPFDQQVAANLATARAMTLNDVPTSKAWWLQIPSTWVKVALVVTNLTFWSLLLLTCRYRQRPWFLASVASGLCLLVLSALAFQQVLTAEEAGAVVIDAVFGKKGPGYAYANAFNEPLHDGLEFVLVEQRDDWGRIQLPDTRQCWILMSQVHLVQR